MKEYVYVTVGTTEFDELVKTIVSDGVLNTLVSMGYERLLIQTGRGKYIIENTKRKDIHIETYNYKDSIEDDLKNASLVISHAGAGSILESLGLKKRLLVVVNDKLMDNHQYELAEKTKSEGYLYYCNCENLKETLETKDFSQLKTFQPANPKLFGDYLSNFMNIVQS